MEDIEVPAWINKAFLENLLTADVNEEGSRIEIIKFETTPGVPKGVNYLSTILRITIEYVKVSELGSEPGKTSLIAKVPLEKSGLSGLNDGGFIEREIETYYEILPKINAIITDHGDVPVTPKCYKCDVKNVLIMNDLVASGYRLLDRREQLGFEHSVLTMRNLAIFHAASIKLHEQEPQLVERIGQPTVFKLDMEQRYKDELDAAMGPTHLEKLCSLIKNWPEVRELAEPLAKLKPKIWYHFLRGMCPNDGELVGLALGDVWVSNILYRHDKDGIPVHLNFVDLQFPRFTCPVMDVVYFTYTSMQYEVKKKHFKEITEVYFNNLNKYLEKYGSAKRLDKASFEKSIRVREIFSLTNCINNLPFTLGDEIEEGSSESEDRYTICLKSQRYREVFAKHLQEFSEKPWFSNFEIDD